MQYRGCEKKSIDSVGADALGALTEIDQATPGKNVLLYEFAGGEYMF